ncbi:dienelactone hydrolase family protein [Synechococcus sp. A15-28]|uniref:dienelactone hydrolase family protein n=1 Tax=Synechococcus sp. A15-28 TaxID=1050638 RepID=UPI00186099D3|nr:dienelactone hydrolase family protein [Synechococcus sp. A15-28]QNI41156.1 dienelactone hydrolase family protein [Synechococcus sp. A15-28]
MTCLCGTTDPWIPEPDRASIQRALAAQDPSGEKFRYEELAGADHGSMCEARSNFQAAATARGWQLLLAALKA